MRRVEAYRGFLEELRSVGGLVGDFMITSQRAQQYVHGEVQACIKATAASLAKSGTDEPTMENVLLITSQAKVLSNSLARVLRCAILGWNFNKEGSAATIISHIVNTYFARIIESTGSFVGSQQGFARLHGQQEKLQLLYFLTREDDVVDRILRRYLPFTKFCTSPSALLSSVIDMTQIMGHYKVRIYIDEYIG
jgi:hypothetical protein